MMQIYILGSYLQNIFLQKGFAILPLCEGEGSVCLVGSLYNLSNKNVSMFNKIVNITYDECII